MFRVLCLLKLKGLLVLHSAQPQNVWNSGENVSDGRLLKETATGNNAIEKKCPCSFGRASVPASALYAVGARDAEARNEESTEDAITSHSKSSTLFLSTTVTGREENTARVVLFQENNQ